MKQKSTNVFFSYRKKILINIMKAFIFFCCATVFSLTPSNILSQNLKIKIDSDKTVSVDEVFDIIMDQTEVTFIYEVGIFNNLPKVNLDKGAIRVNKLLQKSLVNTGFQFDETSENIILIKARPLVVQQNVLIQGNVSDENGMPLPGLSVYVTIDVIDGNPLIKGTTTDFDGNYKLTAVSGKTITVSGIGYVKSEQTIEANKNTYNFVLQEDISELDEVVVTGYQKLSKGRTTGAFETITSKQLQQRPVNNILDKLEGSVAGLQSTNGKLSIRGVGTFTTDSSPLIVVDGFPLTSGSASINPEDVETMTVLKDAAAASIWGTKASNGVIVITTKRGKIGEKLKIDFSAYTAVTEKIDYKNANIINTSEQIDLQLETHDKGWWDLAANVPRGTVPFDLVEEALIYKNGYAPNGNVWTQQQYDSYINELRGRDILGQWSDYLLRNQMNNIYNLSLSGGGEKNQVFASLNYTDSKSASVGANNDRVILNIQNIYKLNKRLSFEAGANIAMQNKEGNGLSAQAPLSSWGYEDLVDENGNYRKYYNTYNRWTSNEREASDSAIMPYYSNMLEEQRASDNTGKGISLRARFVMNYQILPGLKFTSSYQYQQVNDDVDNYRSTDLPSQRIKLNDAYVDETWQLPLGTEYRFTRNSGYSWGFRNVLNFDKTLGKHSLNVLAGTDIRKEYTDNVYDKVYGYDRQTAKATPVDRAALVARQLDKWTGLPLSDSFYSRAIRDIREFSLFSTLGYEYDKKYSVTASFRIDQKNLFGSDPDFRYKPLWSTGIGWNVTNEDFVHVSWLDRLRLRATYGLGGNAGNSGPFAQAKVFAPLQYGIQYLYNYARIDTPANDKLKWEETSTLNVGADFALFGNKVSGSLGYYYKKSTDLLGSTSLDPSTGFSYAVINYGSIDNRGVELTLNTMLARTKDFSWKLGANISYNNNRILDYEINQTATSMLGSSGDRSVGMPIGNIVTVNYAGLDENGNTMIYKADGTTTQYSDNAYADIEIEDLLHHGPTVAPWYGGLSTTLAYKGFDLTVNASYKFGHMFRATIGSSQQAAYGQRVNSAWKNRWQQAGDENITRIPKISYNGINTESGLRENGNTQTNWEASIYNISQDVVLDAGFIRVRDLILGYNIPKDLVAKTFFKSLRLTGQVTNPLLWTVNSDGYDPENYGNEAFANLKTYTIGLRAQF